MGYVKEQGVKANMFVPVYNGNGQKVLSCLALDASTAKYFGQVQPTSSGFGFLSIAGVASTMYKFGVALEGGASGKYIDVAIAGYVPGVNIGGTGNTTAHSTFVKGDAVVLTDTGHLFAFGATWHLQYSDVCSTVQSSGGGCVGVAMSSGETTSVDLLIIEKPYIFPGTS